MQSKSEPYYKYYMSCAKFFEEEYFLQNFMNNTLIQKLILYYREGGQKKRDLFVHRYLDSESYLSQTVWGDDDQET